MYWYVYNTIYIGARLGNMLLPFRVAILITPLWLPTSTIEKRSLYENGSGYSKVWSRSKTLGHTSLETCFQGEALQGTGKVFNETKGNKRDIVWICNPLLRYSPWIESSDMSTVLNAALEEHPKKIKLVKIGYGLVLDLAHDVSNHRTAPRLTSILTAEILHTCSVHVVVHWFPFHKTTYMQFQLVLF